MLTISYPGHPGQTIIVKRDQITIEHPEVAHVNYGLEQASEVVNLVKVFDVWYELGTALISRNIED